MKLQVTLCPPIIWAITIAMDMLLFGKECDNKCIQNCPPPLKNIAVCCVGMWQHFEFGKDCKLCETQLFGCFMFAYFGSNNCFCQQLCLTFCCIPLQWQKNQEPYLCDYHISTYFHPFIQFDQDAYLWSVIIFL